MHGTERSKFEMFQRVREFGNTYREVLSTSSVATQLLAAVGTTIDELTTADMKKLSASVAARADDKAAARRALIDLLLKGMKLARVLRAEGHAVPPCELPASRSSQALVTAGRQLAVEAANFAGEFDGHGMSAAHVTTVTTAFEAACGHKDAGRAGHIAAGARIQRLLAVGDRKVTRLDVVVATLLAGNEEAQAVWKQSRRLLDPRVARGGGETADASPPQAAPSPATPSPATPSPADAPVEPAA